MGYFKQRAGHFFPDLDNDCRLVLIVLASIWLYVGPHLTHGLGYFGHLPSILLFVL